MATKKSAKSATKQAPGNTREAEKVSKAETAAARGKRRAPAKKRSKRAFVKKLLDAAEKKVSAEDVKASIGDVIRLLQLERELEQDEPREIKVQWIEKETEEREPGA